MNSPIFNITPKILNLVSDIQELTGQLRGLSIAKPPIKLRKENRIRTVHSSLAIEGNTLSESQVSDIIENKKVVGPKKQILEVQNAIKLYDVIHELNPFQEKDLLKAHKMLTAGLVNQSGKYRKTQVGIFKGSKVSHVAPPAKLVPELMGNLFHFLKIEKAGPPLLVKAGVFHHELEFIHPFEDGNGRIGRFWQQLILMKHSPIFEYLAVESIVFKKQKQYYQALESSDKKGDCSDFIEFSLESILQALADFANSNVSAKPKVSDRIDFAIEHFGTKLFSRKDYLALNKGISTATASRDLALAVEEKRLKKTGDKNLARYRKLN